MLRHASPSPSSKDATYLLLRPLTEAGSMIDAKLVSRVVLKLFSAILFSGSVHRCMGRLLGQILFL